MAPAPRERGRACNSRRCARPAPPPAVLPGKVSGGVQAGSTHIWLLGRDSLSGCHLQAACAGLQSGRLELLRGGEAGSRSSESCHREQLLLRHLRKRRQAGMPACHSSPPSAAWLATTIQRTQPSSCVVLHNPPRASPPPPSSPPPSPRPSSRRLRGQQEGTQQQQLGGGGGEARAARAQTGDGAGQAPALQSSAWRRR